MFKYLFGLFWLLTSAHAFSFNMPQAGAEKITLYSGTLNDPGGATNYGDNISSILTIYPESKKEMVRLVFTQFRLETNMDYLYVYSGTEVDERNLIHAYTGYALPDTITSNDSTGAITLKFTSDQSINYLGFALNVFNVACADYSRFQTVSSSSSACIGYPIDLSLSGSPLNKTSSCKWQSLVNDTNWTTLSEGTRTTFRTFHKMSTFYRAVVSCPTNKSDTNFASPVFVQTSNTLCYCADSLALTTLANISRVVIKGTSLSNKSVYAGTSFSAYPAKGTSTASLQRGGTYEISVTVDQPLYNISLWIDYNQNLEYEPSEWVMVDSISSATTPSSVFITIPEQAPIGFTGLRLRAVYFNEIENDSRQPSTPATACWKLKSGETEEYYVTIVEATPCTGKPFAGTLKSDVHTICPTRSVSLTLDSIDNRKSNLTYKWESSFDNQVWSSLQSDQLPYLSTTQEKTTYYRCHVACGVESAVTKEIRINSTDEGCTYVVPYQDTAVIRTCNGIVMDHAAHLPYADLAKGMLTILPDKPNAKIRLDLLSIELESYENLQIWNGLSSSSEEIDLAYVMRGENKEGALSLFFESDESITYSGFVFAISCESNCEDVTLVSTTSDVASVCNLDTFHLSLKDDLYNASYQWQRSTNQTTWTNINKAVNSSYKAAQNRTTYYRCQIGCGTNHTIFSQPAKIDLYGSPCYCIRDLNEVECLGWEDGGQNIVNVNIENTDLNNDSQCKSAGEEFNYSLFTEGIGTTDTLYQGESYRLNVTCEKTGFNLSVWIDYNQDKVFAPNEWTSLTSESTSLTFGGTITIPTNIVIGKTRMRLRNRRSGYQNASTDACSHFGSGETEDYIITLEERITQTDLPFTESMITLMPNPSSETVEIVLDTKDEMEASVWISDLMGKDVITTHPYSKGIQFDVSHLRPGFYLVNVEREGRRLSKKMMVD